MNYENLLHHECVCSKCMNRKDCEGYNYIIKVKNYDPNDWTCANAKLDEYAPISIFDFIGENDND